MPNFLYFRAQNGKKSYFAYCYEPLPTVQRTKITETGMYVLGMLVCFSTNKYIPYYLAISLKLVNEQLQERILKMEISLLIPPALIFPIGSHNLGLRAPGSRAATLRRRRAATEGQLRFPLDRIFYCFCLYHNVSR